MPKAATKVSTTHKLHFADPKLKVTGNEVSSKPWNWWMYPVEERNPKRKKKVKIVYNGTSEEKEQQTSSGL